MKGAAWTLAGLGLFLLTVVVHWGSLDGGFVYDDHRFIEHNTALRDLSWSAAFSDPATASHGDGIQHDIYRPLRTILFSLEYKLFVTERADGGVDYHLRWWHLVSVLLHALNVVLVLRVLKPLVRGHVAVAAAGAAVFALHPLTSESVAWLSSQGDLLAMTFLLTSLLVLARPGVGRTVLGAVCFALACFSKESALVLPALLPLRDLALPRDDASQPSPWARTTWVRVGILGAVAILYFVIRLAVLPGLAQVEHPGGSVWGSVRGMAHAMVWYAQALFWPSGFSFDDRIDVPYRWTDPVVWVGFGILASTIAAGIVGLVRKHYLLAFAALGFLVMLGPVSNILVPLKAFVADRFLYPGLLCVAAGVAALLLRLPGTVRMATLTIGCFLLAALGWQTVERNRAWASERALWTAVMQDRPENANAYQGLAFEYGQEGRVAEAERALSAYLQANPNDGKSLRYMGDLFGRIADGLVQLYYVDGTNHAQRRQQARVAQISLYRQALLIWDQPGGLLRGRGSEAMRAEMLEKWIEGAVDLGDLRSAKFANDRLLFLEAHGAYDPSDPVEVMTKASWMRKRARILLALRSVVVAAEEGMPKDLRARLEADRRAVLADVGLDPRKSNTALRHELRLLVEALIGEALEDPEIVPDAGLFLHRAMLFDAAQQRANAIRALEDGLRVHPNHPELVRQLQFRQEGG